MRNIYSSLVVTGAFFLAGCLGTATSDNDNDNDNSNASGEGAGEQTVAAASPSPSSSSSSSTAGAGDGASEPEAPKEAPSPASGGSAKVGENKAAPDSPESMGEGGAGGMAGAESMAGTEGMPGAGGMPGSTAMAGAGGMPATDSSLSIEEAALLVAGTAEACNSFSEPGVDSCGSYYCNVDESTLGAALDPSGVCGADQGNGGGAAFVCGARPVTQVGQCARDMRSANLFASDDELRVLIRECVFEDAEILANMTEPCLDCFIDVAACAADECLFACLGGDGQGCDNCRLENNCDRPLFACAGLPDPF